jgi:hypothetical protein
MSSSPCSSGPARKVGTLDALDLTSQDTWILRNDTVRQISFTSPSMSEEIFIFTAIFWCVRPCILADIYLRFGRKHRRHLPGWWHKFAENIPFD